MTQTQRNDNTTQSPAFVTLILEEKIRALRAEKRALRAQIQKLTAARRKAGLSLRAVSRIAIVESWAAVAPDSFDS